MCGIAGVYHFNETKVDVQKAQLMCNVMAHRGPDGEGAWSDKSNALRLLHRRLSIIDLSDAAAQPMISDDVNAVIAFNGEIYNYIEIKNELIGLGVSFKTNSDTEVLLKAYLQWGVKCLSHLNGMFAFAIWDDAKQELFCARDRFGEKPFHYYYSDDCFVFASEIKSIKAYLPNIKIDRFKLQSYLDECFVINNTTTFFENIHALNPASYLIVSKNKFEKHVYWNIELKEEKLSFDESKEKFTSLFNKSIQLRLRSDVPVGSSLSGGLDSSSIVCSLSALDVYNMQTFSARFKSELDEGKWINDVTNKTSYINNEVWPEPSTFLSELEKMIWHHEYPPGSASVFAQWCVMKLPRTKGVKVLLDGQGADEYLAGYDELKYYALWEHYQKGNFRKFFEERNHFKKHYGKDKSIGYAFLIDPILKVFGKKREVFKNGHSLKQVLKYYTENKLNELLRYADRNSMANSIEVRLPFLDHHLVEFVFSLPMTHIYNHGKTKFILRESMKSVLPDSVYNRTDKIGFAPPQNSWMKTDLVRDVVSTSKNELINKGFQASRNDYRNLVAYYFIKSFNE
jgi:asparagine synthase (glutamine-hydrolysing)